MKKRIACLILCLALIIGIGGELVLSAFSIKAEAAGEVTYSNVLDDLEKDPSFNPADFPEKPTDYSLKVIQIAEGENGEVFVYVYQPNFSQTNLTADYINIAFQDQRDKDQTLRYSKKALVFLNNEGSLCKYVIKDFKVLNETVRYYSVSAVYRKYVEGIDSTYEAIDSVQYCGIPVGKMWSVCLYNKNLQYASFSINVVPVTITASGDILYPESFDVFPGFISSTSINSHYIAFKVDKYDITNVFDVDVTYRLCHYHSSLSGLEDVKVVGDDIYKESETLYRTEEVVVKYEGIFDKTYSWNRIESVDEFKEGLKSVGKELSESESAGVDSAQYVIRIAETEYKTTADTVVTKKDYYALEEGGVLRLHFATPEGVYNLGAVSDLVGTDGKTDEDNSVDFEEWFEKIMSAIMSIFACVIVIMLWGPIKLILKVLLFLSKGVLNVFLWIISFPFKIIGWFFKSK